MEPITSFKKETNFYFNKSDSLQEYQQLFEEWKNKKQTSRLININKITRSGRYTLVKETAENKNSLGIITFSRVIYDNKKKLGAFFIEIYVGPKAGFEKLVLVKNINGVWKIKHEDIFTIW